MIHCMLSDLCRCTGVQSVQAQLADLLPCTQVQPDSLDDLACILEGDCQLLKHHTLPKQKGQQDGKTDLGMVFQPLK